MRRLLALVVVLVPVSLFVAGCGGGGGGGTGKGFDSKKETQKAIEKVDEKAKGRLEIGEKKGGGETPGAEKK
jgi:hypothetical protein